MNALSQNFSKKWIKRSFLLILGVALVSFAQLSIASLAEAELFPTSATPTELRGVWLTNIDSDVLFSRRSLSSALRRLQRLHFNTIYPTVWNWGYTLYPSAVAEQAIGIAVDPHPGFVGRDMLQEAVDRGHEQGLSVIPWFEFGLMAPADSELALRHPEWLTQRQDGSQIIMEGEHPRVWLNPMHPDVQDLIVNLVSEIAANYEVDGIQFDDHFGLPVELGYDPYTIALYREEHSGQSPPNDFNDMEWMSWRANKITELMQRSFHAIKANRPDCLVALSPNPREFSYEMYLQDWWRWEREGFIEELIIQLYRDDLDRFVEELERPEIELIRTHIPLGVGILTGLRNRPIAMTQIQEQVKTVRERDLAGVSFFFYETLGDRDDEFRVLFPTVATRPHIENFKPDRQARI